MEKTGTVNFQCLCLPSERHLKNLLYLVSSIWIGVWGKTMGPAWPGKRNLGKRIFLWLWQSISLKWRRALLKWFPWSGITYRRHKKHGEGCTASPPSLDSSRLVTRWLCIYPQWRVSSWLDGRGPFKVVEKVGEVNYAVKQPGKQNPYPIHHVTLLKPWKGRKQVTALAEVNAKPLVGVDLVPVATTNLVKPQTQKAK